MYVIGSLNKICKTTKIINAFSKGYVSRNIFLRTFQAQNKVEFQNDKSSQEIKKPTVQSDSNDNFIKIYRNRAMFAGAIINSLKWYQTLMTVCSVPTSLVLLLSGTITDKTAFAIVFCSLWFSIILYAQGFVFHRTIGIIYLSKDYKTVKIAYLDFWGKKEEEEYPVEHIEHLSDLPETVTSRLYKTVDFDTEKYRLYVHYFGQILDKDRFVFVFGNVE